VSAYPTKWKRAQQRGCGPDGNASCMLMGLPIENRLVSKTALQVRHVAPKEIVMSALEKKTERTVVTGRDGAQWWASLDNGSRADNRSRAEAGATEREAVQNLAERFGLTWPQCSEPTS
jgi:hypothetical protein